MLKLEKITKIYDTAGFKQKALDEVSMNFRQCEFVSILGPSGSGKTTLLNIIGGLDNYTSGDLVINNISTKKYKDRDWDTYRNHSVGFVFQSYNLIPHQSILSNVELALTLCGVSKSERRKRAKEALKEVGLGNHLGKKPNQLSGGQMQRVAIARALVNNPDILLADEPTGALDSETSTQIMELLKKVANDRLVIMVTHNSELAEEYSTRIIKVKDGVILNDTNPYDEEITTENNITEDNKKKKKTSMSFRTALSLSLNNLMTKKGRTLLTAFAGSIGIIGIALILSLSNGVQNYINKVQEDTLSNYPLTIQEESVDASSMIEIFMNNDGKKYDDNKIHSRQVIGKIFETISEEAKRNNLKAFKEYIEKGDNDIKKYSNVVQYGYNMTPNIYKSDTKDGVVQVNPATTFEELGMTSSSDESSYMMGQSTDVWTEMIDNDELLKSQYDVLSGVWPEKYNEAMLIVNENNEISDYSLYSLGIKDQNDITEKMHKIMSGEKLEKIQDETYSYEDFLGLKYKVLLNTDYYEKQGSSWISKRNDEKYMKSKLKNALEIKIVGIVRPKKEVVATSMGDTGMVGYRKELTEYIINGINDSKIAKEQLDKPEINVFTGRKFELKKKTDSKFDFSSLSKEEQKYLSSLSEEEMAAVISSYTEMSTSTYEENISKLGICNLDEPSSINIYPIDFESKDKITGAIEKYNENKKNEGKEEDVIQYTDMVATMMTSVTVIVNMISYVLIAFVGISLIVSSIMIGIITYISVLERVKEIGILRSIGASKKDISRVFNAETFIVGLVAGLLGIGITILLNIPINAIIKKVADVSNIAKLPTVGAIILVLISMILTMIAGLIPAKMASKKDPVESLRSE
ncbi:MAG: ABC transporter ATP-binding protein/permease [Clostridia bacterium]|nr:ABC transporter ATP-binding protein/permease [Clostridia bacterium]